MIYLASLYSKGNLEENFKKAEEATAIFLKKGYPVVSPIVHCHRLAVKYNLPKTFDFWYRFNIDLLSICETLFILTEEGWEESVGLKAEEDYAEENDIPIGYYTLEEIRGFPEHSR